MLTLEQFRASGTRMTVSEACDAFGVDEEFFSGAGTAAIWLYADSIYIEELSDGRFYTILERDDYIGERADLERILYFQWYIPECGLWHNSECANA